MSSKSPAPYAPTSGSEPSMLLPEHVDGYIDLKTLADIHRFLSQSELNDDLVLAAWVKENYLYEPIVEEGRNIRTTEGFFKLDCAYRRVRLLTNKAQDKWPFFDRRWKSMSSTTVRNNARGESAPGIKLSGITIQEQVVPTDSALATHKEKRSRTPTKLDPFSNKHYTRHQVPSKLCQQTDFDALPTPVSPPPKSQLLGEHQAESVNQPSHPVNMDLVEEKLELPNNSANGLSEDTGATVSLTRDTDNTATGSKLRLKLNTAQAALNRSENRLQSHDEVTDSAEAAENQEHPDEDALHDADGGKVRGRHGRYLPQEATAKPSTRPQRAKKPKPGIWAKKGVDQQNTVKAQVQDDEDPATINVKTAQVSLQDIETSNSKDSDDNITVVRKPTVLKLKISKGLERFEKRDEVNVRVVSPAESVSSGSSLTYKLAAESDPVVSNLDRLPPNCLRRKRQMESRPSPAARKRSRPSSSEPPKEKPGAVDTTMNKKPTTSDTDATAIDGIPQMVTRRAMRRSAVPEVDTSEPAKPVGKQAPTKNKRKEPKNEDVEMLDASAEDASAAHEAESSVPVANKTSSMTVEEAAVPPTPESQSPSKEPLKESSSQVPDIDMPTLAIVKTKTQSKRSKVKPELRTTRKNTKSSETLMTGILETMSEVKADPAPSPNAKLANEISSAEKPGDVVLFARVYTTTGCVEVPLSADTMEADLELVRKYAAWMEKEGGTSWAPFDTFKSILKIDAKR